MLRHYDHFLACLLLLFSHSTKGLLFLYRISRLSFVSFPMERSFFSIHFVFFFFLGELYANCFQ